MPRWNASTASRRRPASTRAAIFAVNALSGSPVLRRLDRVAEAREAYERALELARQAPQRRFLERRLADL
jgi:predicted RNA polymerase sigma factor